MNRRSFLKATTGVAATLANGMGWTRNMRAQATSEEEVVEISLGAFYPIGRWYFDPIGVHIQPGQRVRWSGRKWGGSVTAFHPSHDNHELRIPEGARPFDSGILIEGDNPRARFEWVFEEEGTYDYYSRRQERLGAVGRIVVGSPGGPGEEPIGYGESAGRALTYPDVREVFSWLSSEKIVEQGVIPYPMERFGRTFPAQDSHF
ncbi:MAG: hypothetical protein IH794_03130 [Acidobacteria bacterium]|nr:hypothetical protein [Acidobacteriota bacterium]